jgi:hypothetical protein
MAPLEAPKVSSGRRPAGPPCSIKLTGCRQKKRPLPPVVRAIVSDRSFRKSGSLPRNGEPTFPTIAAVSEPNDERRPAPPPPSGCIP